MDSDLHHSTSPPVPPSELVLKTRTDNTVTSQSEDKVIQSITSLLMFLLFHM